MAGALWFMWKMTVNLRLVQPLGSNSVPNYVLNIVSYLGSFRNFGIKKICNVFFIIYKHITCRKSVIMCIIRVIIKIITCFQVYNTLKLQYLFIFFDSMSYSFLQRIKNYKYVFGKKKTFILCRLFKKSY